MHKIIRSFALLASIPAIAASQTRTAASDTRTDLISNTPAVSQQTDTNLPGPLGTGSAIESPYRISYEGSGTATIYNETAGSGSGVPMTLGDPIRGEAFSNLDNSPTGRPGRREPAVAADSSLDGSEDSFALAGIEGPVSACGGGHAAASRPGAGGGLLGILPADPMPISAVMGLIAVGSLAAAWGWKYRRRPSTA